MALDVRPDQIAVACRTLEAMRAQGGNSAALGGRARIVSQFSMVQLMPNDSLPADIDAFGEPLARSIPIVLARAWLSVSVIERLGRTEEMMTDRAVALVGSLARRSAQDLLRGIDGTPPSRASGEIDLPFEAPAQRTRTVT